MCLGICVSACMCVVLCVCVCVCDLMSACVQRVNECVCPCLHVPVCLLMLVCVNVCSCSSAGRTVVPGGPGVDQVRVKQEPGTKEDYGCTASNSSSSNSSVKTERGNDSGRSACMVTPPSHLPFPLPSPGSRPPFCLTWPSARVSPT